MFTGVFVLFLPLDLLLEETVSTVWKEEIASMWIELA